MKIRGLRQVLELRRSCSPTATASSLPGPSLSSSPPPPPSRWCWRRLSTPSPSTGHRPSSGALFPGTAPGRPGASPSSSSRASTMPSTYVTAVKPIFEQTKETDNHLGWVFPAASKEEPGAVPDSLNLRLNVGPASGGLKLTIVMCSA